MPDPAVDELFQAIKDRDSDKFRELLDAGADPNSRDGDEANDDHLLWTAAGYRQAGMVRDLIKAGADVNATRGKGRTALHNAVWRFDADVVKALVDAGADANVCDGRNWPPIFLADSWDAFQQMAVAGAKLDIVASNGETLLERMIQATAGSKPDDGIKIAKYLIDAGASLDDASPTLLLETIDRASGGSVLVDFLLDSGVNSLATTKIGMTALHYACKGGDLKLVERLLGLGADPNAALVEDLDYRFETGTRPMDMLKEYGQDYGAIKKALLAAGHEANQGGKGEVIPNKVIDEIVVLTVDEGNLEASLDELISLTSDIKQKILEHPDYANPNKHILFRFDIEGTEDDEIEEADFFRLCVQDEALREKVSKFVAQIVEYNYDEEETLYTHEEQEAGGLAMQALVETKDSEFLELLGDYVRSIDVDHTVHLHDLLDSVRAAYDEGELVKLFAYLEDAGFES